MNRYFIFHSRRRKLRISYKRDLLSRSLLAEIETTKGNKQAFRFQPPLNLFPNWITYPDGLGTPCYSKVFPSLQRKIHNLRSRKFSALSPVERTLPGFETKGGPKISITVRPVVRSRFSPGAFFFPTVADPREKRAPRERERGRGRGWSSFHSASLYIFLLLCLRE